MKNGNDKDILEDKEWQDYLEKRFPAEGTRTFSKDIRKKDNDIDSYTTNNQKKKDMHDLIAKLDERNQKNRMKRSIATILSISCIIAFISLNNENIDTFSDLIVLIICSIIGGAIYFYVNSIIFSYLFQKSLDEDKELEVLIKKYEEFKKDK